MTDTVKIVGSCMFYLGHPDTKKLMDVKFFVAANDGTVSLSWKTTLMLGLMQPRTRLDYLPPRASLITSSAGLPKKTKATLCVQKQEVSVQRSKDEVAIQSQTGSVQLPSWSQAKIRFCMNTLMSLKGLVASQDHPIIYRLMQVLHPNRLLVAQFLSTSKKHLNKK